LLFEVPGTLAIDEADAGMIRTYVLKRDPSGLPALDRERDSAQQQPPA
jgi:hypothetical protein